LGPFDAETKRLKPFEFWFQGTSHNVDQRLKQSGSSV